MYYMIRRLIWVAAIACGAITIHRLSSKRSTRRTIDEAARTDWESEGGTPPAAI